MSTRKDSTLENKATLFSLGGIILTVGIGLGIFIGAPLLNRHPATKSLGSIRLSDPSHKLISPILLAGLSAEGDTQELKDIERTLKLLTYDALNVPGVSTISLYYRDLNSGLWAGVGETNGYDPASLLKVPIMIAWFKKVQDDPSILKQELLWSGSPSDNKGLEFFGLVPGRSYSVDYLINLMITKSDNDAKNLLLSKLDEKTLNTVFTDLGIKGYEDAAGNPQKISPVMYSRFLRVLYNATYLNRGMSEKALELLSMSDYNDGLVAGVPPTVKVAHKFGQFSSNETNGSIELHDCGIIYHPKNPYALCVMTEGKTNIVNLESIISDVSSTVYGIVDKEN